MLWTAFILGLGGSLHCIGMCGPIVLLVPGVGSTSDRLGRTLSYNFGRITIYALAGAMFGWLGKGLFVAGWQQGVSIVFGLLLVLGVLFPAALKKWKPDAKWFSLMNQLKAKLFPLLKKQSTGGSYVVGMLNALLPCGLIYTAIAGAVLMGSPLLAAQYMALFGLGTAVAMTVLSMSGGVIVQQYKQQLSKALPVLLFAMGLIFILRGMNLGIPYLSPKMEKEQAVRCH